MDFNFQISFIALLTSVLLGYSTDFTVEILHPRNSTVESRRIRTAVALLVGSPESDFHPFYAFNLAILLMAQRQAVLKREQQRAASSKQRPATNEQLAMPSPRLSDRTDRN